LVVQNVKVRREKEWIGVKVTRHGGREDRKRVTATAKHFVNRNRKKVISLSTTVAKAGGGGKGVRKNGFWGMNLRKETSRLVGDGGAGGAKWAGQGGGQGVGILAH